MQYCGLINLCGVNVTSRDDIRYTTNTTFDCNCVLLVVHATLHRYNSPPCPLLFCRRAAAVDDAVDDAAVDDATRPPLINCPAVNSPATPIVSISFNTACPHE